MGASCKKSDRYQMVISIVSLYLPSNRPAPHPLGMVVARSGDGGAAGSGCLGPRTSSALSREAVAMVSVALGLRRAFLGDLLPRGKA